MEDAGVRERLRQPLEAAAGGPPEAVDGLVRITDDEKIFATAVPGFDEFKLDGTDVLEFIDQ